MISYKKYLKRLEKLKIEIEKINYSREFSQKNYILSEDDLFLINRNNNVSADKQFYKTLKTAVDNCIKCQRKMYDIMADIVCDNYLDYIEDFKITHKTFVQTLFEIIDKKGISDVECYKRAGIDRKLFSKIKKNIYYRPSKKTIIMLIFGLELNIDEAKKLLSKGGCGLVDWETEDVIVKHFIKNEIYNTYLLDETLEHYGISPIFSK